VKRDARAGGRARLGAMPGARIGTLLRTRFGAPFVMVLVVLACGNACAEPVALDAWLGGRETTVDLYAPAAPAQDAVILAHGFARHRGTLAGHAERLAREGVLVAVPDLPYFQDPSANAAALRDLVHALVAGKLAPPVARVVLVGFSAGALSALLAADTPGVAGYVGLDPFDRASGLGRDAAAALAVQAHLLRAPASRCNGQAAAAPWKDALPMLVEDRVIVDATHCDFESPTDVLCRAACGGSDDARRSAIADALSEAVRSLLAPRAP
jgi:dienelactone hydrolase